MPGSKNSEKSVATTPCHYLSEALSCMEAKRSTTSLSVTRERIKSLRTTRAPCATQRMASPYGNNLQRLNVSLSVKSMWPTRPHLMHCLAWEQQTLGQRPERKKGLWMATRRWHSVFRNGQNLVLCPWTPGVAVKPQTRHLMLRCGPARRTKEAVICNLMREMPRKREGMIPCGS